MEKNNQVTTTTNREDFVKLKDINKIYPNGIQAVYDFNMNINEHDFIVLVGPSGCGKSTTLRMVAGLEDITSGSLYINDQLSNYLPSKDRDISMVFQSYALYPQMTVFDNIAFPLRSRKYNLPVIAKEILARDQVDEVINTRVHEFLVAKQEAKVKRLNFTSAPNYVATKLGISLLASKYLMKYKIVDENSLLKNQLKEKILEDSKKIRGTFEAKLEEKGLSYNENYEVITSTNEVVKKYSKLSKEEIQKKVFEVAKILDLGPYLDRRPKELSGGQMQRVALGRAIIRNARLFLMDEPLSNLDAKLRVAMRSEIVRIHEQVGATTIYVTHDQTEAMTMATKIVVMSKGWVQQIGVPQEIYDNPKNLFVATFIGSPAMNILDGMYKEGVITLKNGYSFDLGAKFKKHHDKFYSEKIADLERMLQLDEFKKMHGLSIVDNLLNKIDSLLHKGELKKEVNELERFAHNCFLSEDDKTSELFATIHESSDNEVIIKALNSIKDSFESASIKTGMMNAKALINKYEAIPEEKELTDSLKELQEVALSIEDEHKDIILQQLSAMEQECVKDGSLGELSKVKKYLHNIRKSCLTIKNISPNDLGKLHNAQVFNQKEKKEEDVIFYTKRRNKEPKVSKVKVSSNNTFINNLYEVASNLLENYREVLKGEHEIKVGIRPENIYIDSENNSTFKTAPFTTKSDVVELMGSELLMHTNWNDIDMIAKISTESLIKPHTDVTLSFNGDKVVVFDVYSGDTI